MNIILWLIAGALAGWIAGLLAHTNALQDLLVNAAIGMSGALIGGWLISPLLGITDVHTNVFKMGALIVSLVSAFVCLAIIYFFGRNLPR